MSNITYDEVKEVVVNTKDKFYCDTCECSPCCCFERQIWDDKGGQLTRLYNPDPIDQINQIRETDESIREQEEKPDEEAQPL